MDLVQLPVDILVFQCFSYLEPRYLCRTLSLVCRVLRKLMKHHMMWRVFCLRLNPTPRALVDREPEGSTRYKLLFQEFQKFPSNFPLLAEGVASSSQGPFVDPSVSAFASFLCNVISFALCPVVPLLF